ncbi:hypothetical protein GCM10012275_16120 [Longimycelium tulufanense]|uniref:Uncharacterized protein n=1 Tax=Longimycelium tulufanense TaxID=907463 RepID=A0A8J3CBT9_9PSEU|nr:hypothetical protein [Longimycelium tulufanense]GGM45885.1 hypothetical protein GCM10012275_16120 [Longimycelium tulufanense]
MDPDRDYWHLVEYFQVVRGVRRLVHSEWVCDHGFYVGRRAGVTTVTATAEGYARELCEEHARGSPGRWIVRVWRITAPDAGADRIQKLCTVEVRSGTTQSPPPAPMAQN